MFILIVIILFFDPSWVVSSPVAAPASPSSTPSGVELAAACSPPNIRVTVQNSGTTAFSVPIFTDCTFQDAVSIIPSENPPAPSTAVSASADYDQFVDSTGAPLNQNSVNQLLEFFGGEVDIDLLLAETVCSITDTSNDQFAIQEGTGPVNNGATVQVASYACTIEVT